MPLEILLILVVVGISGIALLLHLTGYSHPRRFETEDEARAAWLREQPRSPPVEIALSDDRAAALIKTKLSTGVVWCFGIDTVARPLRRATIHRTDTGLRLHFPDVGVADQTLTFATLPDWIEDRVI